MKTLLIVGNDKVSGLALESLKGLGGEVYIAVDKSARIKRLVTLIYKGRIDFFLAVKMIFCELSRKGCAPSKELNEIKSNDELVALMRSWQPGRVILFRAGLIINRCVIDMGVPIMNIHCADIPTYGGLGSIFRAISDGRFEQFACLHLVTETIDGGLVVNREPYSMDPEKSYCSNENVAYDAGIRLLKRTVAEKKK